MSDSKFLNGYFDMKTSEARLRVTLLIAHYKNTQIFTDKKLLRLVTLF